MSMVVNSRRFVPAAPVFTPPYVISLVNPGAESGNATGWTSSSGRPLWTAKNLTGGSNPPTIQEGSYYFHASNALNPIMHQDVDVSAYAAAIDAGLVVPELTLYFATSYVWNDLFSFRLIALDGTNTIITSVAHDNLATDETYWIYQDLNLLLPSGTRKLRIEVEAKYSIGVDIYNSSWAWFDNVTLTLYDNTRRITGRWNTAISRGNRAGLITVSAVNITGYGGTPANLVDGNINTDYYFASGANNGTQWLLFDFGASPQVIDSILWRQSNSSAHGVWQLEGSNDNSSWTLVGNSFTLNRGIISTNRTTNTAYRYYRLRAMSGSRSSSPWLNEILFRSKS